MNKPIYLISLAVLLSFVGLILVIVYMLVFPYPTVQYNNIPFPIVNTGKTVRAGDQLQYVVNYCRYTEAVAEVNRNLVNEVVYVLPNASIKAPMGCNTTVTSLLIPKDIVSGIYHLESTVTFKVNALRYISVQTRTENFTVIGIDSDED